VTTAEFPEARAQAEIAVKQITKNAVRCKGYLRIPARIGSCAFTTAEFHRVLHGEQKWTGVRAKVDAGASIYPPIA